MIDPALGQQLADLGGWAMFLLVVAIAAIGLIRQWWVPGWIYRDERAWRERMTAAIERLTDAAFPRRGPGAP